MLEESIEVSVAKKSSQNNQELLAEIAKFNRSFSWKC